MPEFSTKMTIRHATKPLRSPFTATLLTTLVLALASLGTAYAAKGKKSKRILLMPVERGDSVLSVVPREVGQSLRTVLSANRTIEVVLPQELKKEELEVPEEVPKAKKKDPVLERADKALWDAKELAGKERFLAAAKVFKKAMNLYEKRFDKLVDFDKYVDAALGVSLSFFYAGYEDNGEDALAPVMILKPTTVLQARKVPKAATDALERLRSLYSKTPSGRIRVESNPPGAVVYIDGVLRGQTPTLVTGLWRGQHILRLTKDGYEPTAKRFTAGGRDKTVSGTLKPVRVATVKKKRGKGKAEDSGNAVARINKGLLKGAFGKRFGDAAAFLAREFNLSTIVMPYVRRAGRKYQLAAFVFEPASRRVAELEWITFAADLADLQAKLLRVEEQVLQSLVVFPRSRVLSRRNPSKIYETFEEPKPPAPVVVKTPPKPKPQRKPVVAAPVRPKPAVTPPPAPVPVRRPLPERIKPVPRVVPPPPAPMPRAPAVAPPSRPAEVFRPVAPPPSYQPPAQPGGYRPVAPPVYTPRPAPAYAPRPAPVYAPRPAPVYTPRPAPVTMTTRPSRRPMADPLCSFAPDSIRHRGGLPADDQPRRARASTSMTVLHSGLPLL